jgi:AcrR family transcriptional regulator
MLRAPDLLPKPGVEDTRTRILAAARELYASKGSRGTTTREVANLAGVNEATLFRHFGTKTQLLSAMLDHYSTYQTFPGILSRVAGLANIDEQLRELALLTIGEMKEREDLMRVSMAEELSNPDGLSCAWRAPTETRRLLVEWFADRVVSGELAGDAEWLARVFMSLLFSFVIARKIWNDVDVARERSVANIVEIFLNGARAA